MEPTDGLDRQVHEVLEHLYDYPYLQTHALAERLQLGSDLPPRERMRLLRATILEAIEEMNPGAAVPFRSLQARAYNVLNLRYVAGMTVDEVARELGISDRQLYRDLRKAEQDLAALLEARHALSAEAAEPAPEELVLREAQRLGGGSSEVSVEALLQGALGAVERLGQQLGVTLDPHFPATPLTITTDRALARQALVNALSCALQSAARGTKVTLLAQPVGTRVRIQVSYTSQAGAKTPEVSMATAQQLIGHLGGQWSASQGPGDRRIASFTLGERTQTTVLVIDDNEGLHELFRRYLADEDYRLYMALSGREGLRLAGEAEPDIIVLDVMMPQEDGWEVLQSLKTRDSTRPIPVIVCSVLKDPQLAFSLGAADFIAKPVNRLQLLQALARCR